MERDRSTTQEVLRRLALEQAMAQPSGRRRERGIGQAQAVPVNVYETAEDVVIVAPMPGVEAENIDIEVLGSVVTLRSAMRGVGQEDREYLLHEWTYGPYVRSIELPLDVDAEHANASHSNGILVVSLPKTKRAQTVRVPLRQATAAESTHQGHSGHHTTRQGLEGDSTGGE
jgi:HSP20 family protein